MEVSSNIYPVTSAASSRHRHRRPPAARAAPEVEIRVCVNRSCARQGSREVLEALSGLAPPDITIASCGCLGRCGAGPNLAVLPRETMFSHCGTAARAVQLLADLCGPRFDPQRNLEALALRKKGELDLEQGNASKAESLLSQAIDLEPSGGLHFLYGSRSAARLAMGHHANALRDAQEASRLAPTYPQAYICEGDVLLAMGELDAAEGAYSTALMIDPSIRRSKSFKARVARLRGSSCKTSRLELQDFERRLSPRTIHPNMWLERIQHLERKISRTDAERMILMLFGTFTTLYKGSRKV